VGAASQPRSGAWLAPLSIKSYHQKAHGLGAGNHNPVSRNEGGRIDLFRDGQMQGIKRPERYMGKRRYKVYRGSSQFIFHPCLP
jgi:hypothetical protein